jgi:FkbM family methyltransferase
VKPHTDRIKRTIRDLEVSFTGGNRSLELCSRMNYETEILDLIDAQSAGTVFYDLGACEGRFSVYAAVRGLRVYAFEPDADNFKTLLKNALLNQLSEDQLKPYKLGVGETCQEAILKIGQPWAGGHQKVIENPYERNDLGFEFKTTARISVVALDEFIVSEGLDAPECLKIDIDGSERAFVGGARATLAGTKLRSLMVELYVDDPHFNWIVEQIVQAGFTQVSKHSIPNEEKLFNFRFERHP